MTQKESKAFAFFVGVVRSVQGNLAWYASDYNTKEIQHQADRLDAAIKEVYKAMK